MEVTMSERVLNTGEAKICEVCSKSPYWCATGHACSVFEHPRKSYGYRMGECAFNAKLRKTKTRGRVGQQKTKRETA